MDQRPLGFSVLLALGACSIADEGSGNSRADLGPQDAMVSDGGAGNDAAVRSDASLREDAGTSDGAATDALPCNGHVELCTRRYNEVAYPSTHNSHAAQEYGYGALIANQGSGLGKQLDDGVRGFLMDVYDHNGEHVLCHGPCSLKNTPHADWLNILKTFLAAHPREVVTIIYQDGLAADQIAQDFAGAGLNPYLYTHAVDTEWPTLAQMIEGNTRLVVTAENGRPPPAWFQHVWDIAWDTPYEFRTASQFTCVLNRGATNNPLFLVNHWLSSGIGTVYLPNEEGAKQVNNYDILYARGRKCQSDTGQLPNFIAVDFYEHGDLFKVVDALNGF